MSTRTCSPETCVFRLQVPSHMFPLKNDLIICFKCSSATAPSSCLPAEHCTFYGFHPEFRQDGSSFFLPHCQKKCSANLSHSVGASTLPSLRFRRSPVLPSSPSHEKKKSSCNPPTLALFSQGLATSKAVSMSMLAIFIAGFSLHCHLFCLQSSCHSQCLCTWCVLTI